MWRTARPITVTRFELTGALQLVIPFMVTVMAANGLGNLLTCSMDYMHIHLRGYPHLESNNDVVLKSHAYDIMDEELECLTCDPCRLSEFSAWIERAEYGGFPVVLEDCTLLGSLATVMSCDRCYGLTCSIRLQNHQNRGYVMI